MPQAIMVLTNLPDLEAARRLARSVVEQKLAACVNIWPGVQSVYRWQGAVEEATEWALSIKTTPDRYAELELAIKRQHPYAVPEIIALPIVAGSREYLNWIADETNKDVNA
jgi:periplasmic divalent cation tolerance protein